MRSSGDRFYTPEGLAREVVAAVPERLGVSYIDPACGRGSLLRAAAEARPGVECVGADVDSTAISKLKKQYPRWRLAVADALAPENRCRLRRLAPAGRRRIVITNPPFSMGATKGRIVVLEGGPSRCSTGMAHVIAWIRTFSPSMAVSLLPESALYSHLDAAARDWIQKKYRIEELDRVNGRMFRGAHARMLLVRFRLGVLGKRPGGGAVAGRKPRYGFVITRGGLPVHEAIVKAGGIPFLHTTSIWEAVERGPGQLERVLPLQRGVVSGTFIAIPRVGLPRKETVRLIRTRTSVQLSDCVIALQDSTEAGTGTLLGRLRGRFGEFRDLYRGTGAPYVTVERLGEWLGRLGS